MLWRLSAEWHFQMFKGEWKKMSEFTDPNKDAYELSLATTLHDTCLPKSLADLFMNSKCSAQFTPLAMMILGHEKAMIQKMGVPNGWNRPLFEPLWFFRKFIIHYLQNSPSINSEHLIEVLKGVGEASKRPPKLQLGIPSNLDQNLEETSIDE